MAQALSVTEAARHFAECINRVVYRGESFVLARGNKHGVYRAVQPEVRAKRSAFVEAIAADPRGDTHAFVLVCRVSPVRASVG